VEEMMQTLSAAMDAVHALHAKELFKEGEIGHVIILTLAFCHLLRAAKLIDIKKCFDLASIEIGETTLKHCIDILVICELVKPVRHGKLDFYVALVEALPLEIAFKKGIEGRDRSAARWTRRIINEITSDKNEKFRLDMFKEARNG